MWSPVWVRAKIGLANNPTRGNHNGDSVFVVDNEGVGGEKARGRSRLVVGVLVKGKGVWKFEMEGWLGWGRGLSYRSFFLSTPNTRCGGCQALGLVVIDE